MKKGRFLQKRASLGWVGKLPEFMAEKESIYSLQIYRGIAALSVVLYHATVFVDERYQHAPLGGLFAFGFFGVHIFFVLSGFIMLFVHAGDFDRPGRLWPYIKKRFTRIYPVYWAVLLPSALFYFFYLERPFNGYHFFGNLALIMLSKFDPIEPVAWTLFHEILFYTLFATLIVKFRLGVILFAGWIALVLFVGYLGVEIAPPYLISTLTGLDYGAIRAFFDLATSSLNGLFLFGLAAYALYRLLKKNAARDMIGVISFIAGILLIVACGVDYNRNHPILDYSWAHLHHLTLGFGLAGLLLMTSAASPTIERFFSRRWILLFLGNASYSIYLTHYFLQKFLGAHLPEVVAGQGETTVLTAFLALVVMSLLCGSLFYVAVERPLLGKCRAWFGSSRHGKLERPAAQS
jgi:exopolysaccharide production protein ExoZ